MKSSTFLGLGFLLLIFLGSSEAAAKASAKNGQSLKSWLLSMRPKRNENSQPSDRIWTLADALPGEPGRDYPIFAKAPETGFSCDNKKYGYYADIEARCQVFHICANTAGSAKGFEFLCPNGTLFNQRYFVCDWYMNVNCEESEKYYNLNDLIGDSMDSFNRNDIMSSAKDIMSYTKQPSQPGKGGNQFNSGSSKGDRPNGGDANRRTGTTSTGGPSSSPFNGNVPLRGSANLAQPTAGGNGHPGYTGSRQGGPPSTASGPYSNGNLQRNSLPGGPQRGANGGTVYVNSLGQLSTDDNSGFDPKNSFILRPDKDSKFDQDTRIPNDITAPLRGSADLSEPVDPSVYGKKNGPSGANGGRKQIYTYPSDSNGYQQSSIPPEQQGQLNTKLASQAPKYPASQIYGPALSQPGQFSPSPTQEEYPSSFRTPSSQSIPQAQYPSSSQRGPSPSSLAQSQYPNSQGGSVVSNYPKANYPSPQRGSSSQFSPQNPSSRISGSPQNIPQRTQYPNSQSQNYPSSSGHSNLQRGGAQQTYPQNQNAQRISQLNNGQQQARSYPKNPFTQTQRGPSSVSHPSNQLAQGHRSNVPQSQVHTPQKTLPQSYQPSRPGFDASSPIQPQKLYQQPNGNRQSPSNVPQSFKSVPSQQQTQRRLDGGQDNRHFYQSPESSLRSGPSQSNEEYLRVVLKDKNNVHDDNNQLIELIQRLFVPQNSQTRVVSAEVHPSKEQESYSFTYDGNGVASNTRSNYQQPNHQHSNTCGHQGY